jgi:hypothetical protein
MESTNLTSGAYALHNLGLAAGFGGSLFGKVALNPSVRLISDSQERSKVVNAAWNGYNVLNAISLATTALTWIAGRSVLSGRKIGRDVRSLVKAKDYLMATTVATGLINVAAGTYMGRAAREGRLPMESGSKPGTGAAPGAATATKLTNWLGILNMASMAGVIALSAYLDNRASRTRRWRAIARVLP